MQFPIFLYAFFGSLMLYVFYRRQEENILDAILPHWENGIAKDICGLLAFGLIGALATVVIVEPSTERQAFFTGMVWPTLINHIVSRSRSDRPLPPTETRKEIEGRDREP